MIIATDDLVLVQDGRRAVTTHPLALAPGAAGPWVLLEDDDERVWLAHRRADGAVEVMQGPVAPAQQTALAVQMLCGHRPHGSVTALENDLALALVAIVARQMRDSDIDDTAAQTDAADAGAGTAAA